MRMESRRDSRTDGAEGGGGEEVSKEKVKYSREMTYSILLLYRIDYAERLDENRKTKAGLAK
jgi:hypothetical protein